MCLTEHTHTPRYGNEHKYCYNAVTEYQYEGSDHLFLILLLFLTPEAMMPRVKHPLMQQFPWSTHLMGNSGGYLTDLPIPLSNHSL